MNIFYTPENHIYDSYLELHDQEARHASKVLRLSSGDSITVVDGRGRRYTGTVQQTGNDLVRVQIEEVQKEPPGRPRLIVGLGIIKKRDRLEFAVEKAVELGAAELVLFQSRHTVKQNVRLDRLQATALSAMKQSLRAYLPAIHVLPTLEAVLKKYEGIKKLVAHEKADVKPGISSFQKESDELLLMVGPEGGFSDREIEMMLADNGEIVSLGAARLRAETAVVALLSQLL
jgi:16S rRNA (uracil1498-N3)-methyltransferase